MTRCQPTTTRVRTSCNPNARAEDTSAVSSSAGSRSASRQRSTWRSVARFMQYPTHATVGGGSRRRVRWMAASSFETVRGIEQPSHRGWTDDRLEGNHHETQEIRDRDCRRSCRFLNILLKRESHHEQHQHQQPQHNRDHHRNCHCGPTARSGLRRQDDVGRHDELVEVAEGRVTRWMIVESRLEAVREITATPRRSVARPLDARFSAPTGEIPPAWLGLKCRRSPCAVVVGLHHGGLRALYAARIPTSTHMRNGLDRRKLAKE